MFRLRGLIVEIGNHQATILALPTLFLLNTLFFKFFPLGTNQWINWLNLGTKSVLLALGLIAVIGLVVQRNLNLGVAALIGVYIIIFLRSLRDAELVTTPLYAMAISLFLAWQGGRDTLRPVKVLVIIPLGLIFFSGLFWPWLGDEYFRDSWTSLFLGEFHFFMGVTGHNNHFGYAMLLGLFIVTTVPFERWTRGFLTLLFSCALMISGSDGAIYLTLFGVALVGYLSDRRYLRRGLRAWRSKSALLALFVLTAWGLFRVYSMGLVVGTSGRTRNWEEWSALSSGVSLDKGFIDPHVAWLFLLSTGGFLAIILAGLLFFHVFYWLRGNNLNSRSILSAALLVYLLGGGLIESSWANPQISIPTVSIGLVAALAQSRPEVKIFARRLSRFFTESPVPSGGLRQRWRRSLLGSSRTIDSRRNSRSRDVGDSGRVRKTG